MKAYCMTDIFTKEKRSEIMSGIRSKWTDPEKTIHGFLKSRKIRHKMHPKMEGNPDILLINSRTLVFLDGCFWHKCPKHYTEPGTRRDYWIPKIEKNVKRDREMRRELRKMGYGILKFWEHDISSSKTFLKVLEKMTRAERTISSR